MLKYFRNFAANLMLVIWIFYTKDWQNIPSLSR